MNKKLVKTVLVAYSKIRKIIEPLMFKLFSQKTSYNKHKWDLAKTMGIDDFDNLIRDNYYFIDKSLLIKDIVEDETSKIILLPRPRRFGKSLNMSMLKYFFTNKNKEKNRELFNYLKIKQETETMKKQGKYPLLYMSFKDIKTLNWENCYNKVKRFRV